MGVWVAPDGADITTMSSGATGAEGQTSAPVSPRAGGDPTAVDGDATTRRVLRPDPTGACPCCGQRLKRGRGRPRVPADVVALIVELRGEGLSIVRVANELDRRGVPTMAGGRWGGSSVAAILRRIEDAVS